MSEKSISELLVHKYLTKEISDQELADYQGLLQDAQGRKDASDIEKIWTSAAGIGESIDFGKQQAYAQFKMKTSVLSQIQDNTSTETLSPQKNSIFPFYKIALAAAACLGLVFVAKNFLGGQLNSLEAGNSSKTYVMDDGSVISLEKGSTISWNKAYNNANRDITLKGKALFEVAKNKQLAFRIHANEMDVTVYGTTFYVDADQATSNVMVLEGKVKVEHNQQSVMLDERQGAKMNQGALVKMEDVNFESLSFYKTDLAYDNEPLAKVLSDIEISFGVRLVPKARQDLSHCMFSSKSLKDSKLDQIFSVLELTFNTKFTKTAENSYTYSTIYCK